MQWCTIFSNYRPYYIIQVIACFFCVAIVTYIAIPYRQSYLATHTRVPITIYDRNGTVLMEIARDKSGLAQYIDLKKIPEEFIALLLFSEDRKFYTHIGVSPSAIARAIYQNIKAMRVVSGGSTITQQLVKSKKEILRNTILTKILEIIEAIRLEMHFTKKEILAAYINEVYLGNNIYGFEKASQCYFGKSFTDCNLLEVAFLISIVKAPGRYNPYKKPEIIVQNAKSLLQKANESGFLHISPAELNTYMQKKISLQYTDQNITAPLFCLYVLSQARKLFPDKDIVDTYTTLDVHLYKNILSVMKNSLDIIRDSNASHAAMVMIDNSTMEILVMIGSVDFFDYEKGQVDATLIRRQTASTMKPFAYALALDKEIFHTSSILPDVYTQFYSKVGTYIPKNFSQSYHGPVRLAKALGCSYNIPAVYVVNAVGLVPFYNFLKEIGFDSITRSPSHYGLGIVLGNADVSLIELANAYTIFPRNGIFSKAVAVTRIKDAKGTIYNVQKTTPKRLLKSSTCFLISHILSDYSYKVDAFGVQSAINFPFPFAVKTGTSKDFHDNFIVGYNNRYTIGIWVGNLYNKPMYNLPAVSGAGIVLKDVLLYLWNTGYEFPPFKPISKIKETMICKLSGMVAGKFCHDTYTEYYDEDNFPTCKCTWHSNNTTVVPVEYTEWAKEKKMLCEQSKELKIIFPLNGSVFKIEKAVRKNIQAIPLKAQTPGKNIRWYVNGNLVGTGNEVIWRLIKGEHTITINNNGQMDSVRIRVIE